MEQCEYCGENITKPYAKHYRSCVQANNARYKAAVGLAMVCEDTESIKSILGGLNE